MRIPEAKLRVAWEEFLRSGVSAYERAAAGFAEKQPHLSRRLREVDQEWFGARSDHVHAYGIFVWSMMADAYGEIPPVTQELLDQLWREERRFGEQLENESEFGARELIRARFSEFPEPLLAAHIQSEFAEGSAGARELNPQNNEIAVQWLLITIRALTPAGDHKTPIQ